MSVRGVDGLALDLLGGDVLGRADHQAGLGEVGALGGLGDAEVGDLHPAVAGEEQLAGLMSRWTSPARWAASRASATWAASPAACHGSIGAGSSRRSRRVRPGHQLHHDRLGAVLGAGVVDRDDARVGEPGGGDRLLPEPGDEAAVGGQVRVEQLHRHLAAQDLVGAPPHLGHAARGEQLLEPVAAGQQPARLRDARGRRRRAVRRGSGGRHGPPRLTPRPRWLRSGGRGGGGQRAATQVTPMTRGPPWVPITGPITPDPDLVARARSARAGRASRRRRARSRGATHRCSIAPASATLSRSTSSAFLRVRGLPASSTFPVEMSRIGLIDSSEPSERLGAADAAALLQVVEGVEGAEHVGARGQVLHERDDVVGRRAARRRPRRRAAPGCRGPTVIECESTTRTSSSPSTALAAFWADCIVADRSALRLMHTTASAPACCCRRNAASNLPGRRGGRLREHRGGRRAWRRSRRRCSSVRSSNSSSPKRIDSGTTSTPCFATSSSVRSQLLSVTIRTAMGAEPSSASSASPPPRASRRPDGGAEVGRRDGRAGRDRASAAAGASPVAGPPDGEEHAGADRQESPAPDTAVDRTV